MLIELIVLISLASKVSDLELRLDSSESEIVELKSQKQKGSDPTNVDPENPADDEDDDDQVIGGNGNGNVSDERMTDLEESLAIMRNNLTELKADLGEI